MIEVLLLSRTHGASRVRLTVDAALSMGTASLSAVRYLFSVDCRQADADATAVEVGALRRSSTTGPFAVGFPYSTASLNQVHIGLIDGENVSIVGP